MVDIIIPILNEEEYISRNGEYFTRLSQTARVFFIDGGSRDRSVAMAQNYGIVLNSVSGRAVQKNHGAEATNSDVLLFLHVDTLIDCDRFQQMIQEFIQSGYDAACMTLQIDDQNIIFRVFENMINLQARWFKVLDGDLGLLIKRDLFNKIGGFDSVKIMEDVLMAQKAKKEATVVVLPYIIKASPRKWYEQGFWNTLSAYTWAYLKLWFGLIKRMEVAS